ncbi:SMP-30/gluconolactonase/LRE family protein [Chitinophaga horti]|uniref:SMP-30/gluconolactonase/LRE family protein n=1 Tax=Chitinophaga horti TaxID=2920382 RepID=A0ABY6IYK6_9BACT|nr:SMP-30/gluconolactonase/LRE family protein [Chitinophaga horti]UYQ92338.1 SMP-30/gluconolactonase/LRE family protein [Chitinophaga horti]
MSQFHVCCLLLILGWTGRLSAQDTTSLVAPGAVLQKVSSRFKFTEGPAVNRKGEVFFTDQPNDQIWKYGTDGQLSLFMEKTGRANGLYFDKKGNLVSCSDEHNELWSITPGKKVTVLMSDYAGKKHNGPNDLWIDASGGIYFSDPYYQRDYWTRKSPELGAQMVYYLPKGQKQAIPLDTLQQPNGLVGTPDGKWLYVSDIRAGKIYRYRIAGKGKLADKTLFASNSTDGMTLDKAGNLYLAGNGVTVFNRDGQKLMNIPVPSRWVGNVCFGGKKRDILVITASESLYTLKMTARGVE